MHAATTLQESGLACPENFFLHEAHCYLYSGAGVRKSFHHAEKTCARAHANLASVLSRREQEFVVDLVSNYTAFWIGLNDEDHPGKKYGEGVFRWTSGQRFNSSASYQNWKSGEPNNHNHVDCVKSDASGWSMVQGGCGVTKLPYVCKKKGT